MKKKCIWVSVMLMLLMTGGCWESVALVVGGAAGGMTTQRIIQQQKEVAQANIDAMEQELLDIEEKIIAETDEAKKAELQETRDNIKTVLLDLETQKAAIIELERGLGTDWGKPAAVVGTISSILLAWFADRERRKKNDAKADAQENQTAVVELVAGGEAFKKKATPEAVTVFKAAHKEAQKSQVTKEMVAVIKA